MNDSKTREAIWVRTAADAGPYIITTRDQIPQIRAKLDRHPIVLWADTEAISFDGESAMLSVNFGRTEVATKIQAILDEQD